MVLCYREMLQQKFNNFIDTVYKGLIFLYVGLHVRDQR